MTAAIATTNGTPGIGHNQPPDEARLLHDKLAAENEKLTQRRDDLVAAAGRVPATIETDEQAGNVGDFIKQIGAAVKVAESSRTAAKEPHLAAGRVVDGFFKKITDPLDAAKREINRRLTAYLQKKADDERRKREAEEAAAKAAAAKAAEDAAKKAEAIKGPVTLDKAIAAEGEAKRASEEAQKATQAAQAKPADLSRTRGDYGAVASLRTELAFDGLDRSTLDLEALRHLIPVDGLEKAVRAFIRANADALRGAVKENRQPLKGVRIFERSTSAVH